ncbi:MAG: hypothetical protein LQ350_001986 [Teloschistes chrysophthalmus]|nr:MAG: hypothetical protein LQ350_001986 [Niorma chrysophthalma]
MPTARPLAPKRPKLSLQTSTKVVPLANSRSWIASSNVPSLVEAPTSSRGDISEGSEAASATPTSTNPRSEETSAQLPQAERPSPQNSVSSSSVSSISTLSSGPSSPFAATTPYTLGIGSRSILRNSPLPRRSLLHVASRSPKRLFQPMRRVRFHEPIVEWIPPATSELDTSPDDNPDENFISSEDATLPVGKAGSGSKSILSSPVKGRRKRRVREWIWRPMDEESSPVSEVDQQSTAATSSIPADQDPTEESRPLAILPNSVYQEGALHQ